MAKMPNISDLKRPVALQEQILTSDGQGGTVSTWTTVVNTWAKIDPISTHEKIFAEQAGTLISHKVTMRYRTDLVSHYAGSSSTITRRYRLLFQGRALVIAGVRVLEEGHRFVELACNEKEAV